jgi:hypothetical protein
MKLRATGIEKTLVRNRGRTLHSLRNYLIVQRVATNACNELGWTAIFFCCNGCWLNAIEGKLRRRRRRNKVVELRWERFECAWRLRWKVSWSFQRLKLDEILAELTSKPTVNQTSQSLLQTSQSLLQTSQSLLQTSQSLLQTTQSLLK